ncbi:MAG TPA: oligosaccharide flippase family protein, partial [Phormidium sp.]
MSKTTKKGSSANPEQYLETHALKADLAGRSIRGGTVTMVSQAAKLIMQFGSTAIVARLIAPEDFGLIAMVNGVTGFISMFKDMGLSMATVQKAEVTHRQVSNLFWINVVVSIIFALLTTLLAPGIAWFYKEPRLVLITCVAASGFVFGGLTTQHNALLNRQMRFTSLAAIDVAATLLGNLAAVLAALSGFGYWSLVLMQLVIALSNAGGVWLMCGWRPGLPTRQAGI